jgi:hypothetical protein
LLHPPFDLHVLGTPPAFILSQDQTLRINITFSGANYGKKTTTYCLLITLQLLRCHCLRGRILPASISIVKGLFKLCLTIFLATKIRCLPGTFSASANAAVNIGLFRCRSFWTGLKDVFHFVTGLSLRRNPFRLTDSDSTRFPVFVKGFFTHNLADAPLRFRVCFDIGSSLLQVLLIGFSLICFREISCFSNAAGWIIPLYTTLSRDSEPDFRPIWNQFPVLNV